MIYRCFLLTHSPGDSDNPLLMDILGVQSPPNGESPWCSHHLRSNQSYVCWWCHCYLTGPLIFSGCLERQRIQHIHARKPTWNLKIIPLEKQIIFQTQILGFHVSFRGCAFPNSWKLNTFNDSIMGILCLCGGLFLVPLWFGSGWRGNSLDRCKNL